MQKKKTPNPFIVACDKFIYVEILKKKNGDEEVGIGEDQIDESSIDKITNKEIKLISATISDLADEGGWAFLGDVGSLLQKKQPNFDSRNYGFQKLTPLIKSIKQFDIDERDSQNGRIKLVYVRIKRKRESKAKR